MEPKVLFENSSLLVLDKPSGWVVNEAKTTGKNPVVQTWLKENFQFPISNIKEYRNGIVHRLDKETSGVLVVAKTKKAFEDLQRQFKERKVIKTYAALVHGRVEPTDGEIDAPVGRLPWNRERFGVLPGGRTAFTKYKVNNYYKKDDEEYSLLEALPRTGRTHQIRIHLKHINHPIVSDEFYAGRKRARADREWCPRLFLHASALTISHSGEKHDIKSKLSSDLSNALKLLE